jgi:hypothetical protein
VLGDLQLHDLAGAFVDPQDAGIAEEALGRIFGEVARPAIDLDAAIGDAAAGFGSEQLGSMPPNA